MEEKEITLLLAYVEEKLRKASPDKIRKLLIFIANVL